MFQRALAILQFMSYLLQNRGVGGMLVKQAQERPGLASINPTAALKGFFSIMDAWDVGARDARILLGEPGERTYYSWRNGEVARVSQDTLRRIGYIAGIYSALQILYADGQQADSWVKRPNRAFGDQAPLQRMIAGDIADLIAVRGYLDAARAPWS